MVVVLVTGLLAVGGGNAGGRAAVVHGDRPLIIRLKIFSSYAFS